MNDQNWVSLPEFIEPFRVKPGSKVTLERDFDPAFKAGLIEKAATETLLLEGVERLRYYQDRLAAQNSYGVVVVIQALDAAGKDGTVSHVMSGMNPLGVYAYSFKAPSTEELDHDYLWRCAKRLPARGEIAVFNRSHYEEVLAVRVHPEYLDREMIPESCKKADIWKRRYREINNWERYLTDNGFRVVKLFLNVSRDEQRRRFLDRIEQPNKNWKFSPYDLAERDHWDEYQQAFSEMLSNTSTRGAPWYVVPADHKWFAHIVASAVIVHALAQIDPQYPAITEEAKQQLAKARVELGAEAGQPDAAHSNLDDRAPTAERAPAAPDEGMRPPEGDQKVPEGSGAPSKPKLVKVRLLENGKLELYGKRYATDVVVEAGKVRRRRKKPSRELRERCGHTPLTTAEKLPWDGKRLIVGTGLSGAMPVAADIYVKAENIGVEIVAAPLAEALVLLDEVERSQAFAVLHIGC